MNAKKKLLGGMSLNGQAIPVGGIILDIAMQCQGSIKVPRACPWGCFPLKKFKKFPLDFATSCVYLSEATT